jgi:hypothetical protein
MATIEEMRQALAASGPSVEEMRRKLMGGVDDTPINKSKAADIPFADRFAVKNFGGSPETSIAYLKKNNPGLMFKQDDSGAIIAKKPEDKEWNALDPEGFDLQDVTDVGYDVVSGLGSGALTAAAGLGAGASTMGGAAIPAAMAAGGASSAALEALRQRIGQGLGTHEEDMNTTDLALAGGLGAVSPLLFGTGASAGKIAAKAGQEKAGQNLLGSIGQGTFKALTEGEKKTAAELLANSQKNIFSRMFMGSDVAQNASRQAPDVVKQALGKAGQSLSQLDAGDTMYQKGMSDVVVNLANNVKDKVWNLKSGLINEFENALAKVGGVDPKPHYQAFDDLLNELKSSDLPIAPKQAAKLEASLDDLFFKTVEGPDGEPVKVAIDALSGKDAMRLKQELKDLSSTFVSTDGKPVHSKEVMMTANKAMFSISDALEQKLNEAGGKGLTGRYKDFSRIEERLEPFFDDPDRMFSFLRTANNKAKKQISQEVGKIDREYNLGIRDVIDQIEVMNVYAKAPWNPISDATTSTTKTLNAARVGGTGGRLVGRATGIPGADEVLGTAGAVGLGKVLSRGAQKKVIQAKNILEDLGRFGVTPNMSIGDILRAIDKRTPSATSTANILGNINRGEDK